MFYADITQSLNFCLCREVVFCNNTTYFAAVDDELVLNHLFKYLNSPIADWYYRTLSVQLGEKAVRMFSIYVMQMPIPPIASDDTYDALGLTREEILYMKSLSAMVEE